MTTRSRRDGQRVAPQAPSPRSTVRQRANRAHYDRATVNAILDEGLVAHVALRAGDQPVVIPMTYGRDGDVLYLHGGVGSRLLRGLRDGEGAEACVAVTLLDGLVLARSAFHHSMNYRSVVVFGRVREVRDPHEKRRGFERLVEHIVPGRARDARAPNDAELGATMLLALTLSEASAKLRSGPPLDDADDLAIPVWAGVIPVATQFGPPAADPFVEAATTAVPEYVARYARGAPGRTHGGS
jgi:uncharacterized protein